MSDYILAHVENRIGTIVLNRPSALNSLSLEMVRAITETLRTWRDADTVRAVIFRSSSEKAFCAGGDIRFFYEAANNTPRTGSALLEDFFTEEYALNHLVHHYPKPYIAVMDGIVMGGGMGIAQCRSANRMRIVTERTRMAMPEVNIGLFPDVGASYFLSRAPGELGTYLGITGEAIGAAEALHADLADVFIPSAELPAMYTMLSSGDAPDIATAIRTFAAPFEMHVSLTASPFAVERTAIERHFSHASVSAILTSLQQDKRPFTQKALAAMARRSPLMMSVTLAQLRRGTKLSIEDCLRMERTMIRRSFEHSEVMEGIRAVIIDKDNAPKWSPARLDDVSREMVERFFAPAWPAHAHPLRDLVNQV